MYPDLPGDDMKELSYAVAGLSYIIGGAMKESHEGKNQFWHGMSDDKSTNQEVADKIVKQAMSWLDEAIKYNGTERGDRYINAVAHMVQDTRCKSHVWRDKEGNVRSFQDYKKQKEAGLPHSDYDEIWKDTKTLQEGARQAVNDTKFLLKEFNRINDPNVQIYEVKANIERYLRNNVVKVNEDYKDIAAGAIDTTLIPKE
jgi:hypothetical protein